VREDADEPALVELALWFHDAVYDPRRSDNEEQSAQWATTALTQAGADPSIAEAVADMIRATDHGNPKPTGDTALLCDIDLAVLGEPPRRYDRYERAIRAEYQWVPEECYRAGRAEVLGTFLERDRIYATACFRRRHEPRARQNLARAVAQLKGNA